MGDFSTINFEIIPFAKESAPLSFRPLLPSVPFGEGEENSPHYLPPLITNLLGIQGLLPPARLTLRLIVGGEIKTTKEELDEWAEMPPRIRLPPAQCGTYFPFIPWQQQHTLLYDILCADNPYTCKDEWVSCCPKKCFRAHNLLGNIMNYTVGEWPATSLAWPCMQCLSNKVRQLSPPVRPYVVVVLVLIDSRSDLPAKQPSRMFLSVESLSPSERH